MFGYVKTKTAELKVKEHEFYRGTYCGLCRAMGKCTGQCSRMTLSYDFVFLALVRIALSSTPTEFEQKRCLAHPLKKRNSMKRNPALDYCAGVASLLSYNKIKDDICDERGAKRLRAYLALPFAAHARKKALRHAPELKELDRTLCDELERLSSSEKNSGSVDLPALCFGDLLGRLVCFGYEDEKKRIAFSLGRSVGAWIYIIDAIDDLPEDRRRGRYNPLLALNGGKLPSNEELRSLEFGIKNHLLGAEAALDLADIESNIVKSIIENILYLGITEITDNVIRSYLPRAEKVNEKEEQK